MRFTRRIPTRIARQSLVDSLNVTIDLVVVNYKTPEDLEAFLDSLDAHPPVTPATLTVVEVDDENYEHRFHWAGGEGHTIGVATNIGYARACNLAASRTTGSVIAFFNADVLVTSGAIDQCYRALTCHADWGVLGPCQVDPQGLLRHAGIFGTHSAPVMRGWNERNTGQYCDVREAITVAGSAYFIRREVWDQLTACPLYREVVPNAQGAFLPTPHYFEETFASYHAHAHGHKVMYYGPVTMIHKWHRASPIGGLAEQQFPISQKLFRQACDHHGIAHD